MLEPLSDRIIMKEIEYNKTSSGIILSAEDNKSFIGEVVSVGKSVKGDISVGDMLVYSKFSEAKILVNGEEYIVCREESIIAKIDK